MVAFLNVFNAYKRNNSSSKWCHSNMLHHRALEKAVSIRNQLSKSMRRFGYKVNSSSEDVTILIKTLVTGFFHQVAKLNPDGTFRYQMSFQDGLIDYPIMAVAADGEQNRSIHMKFTRETPSRNTNTKDEAVLEWLF